MSNPAISGTNGTATLGGSSLCAQEWNVSIESGTADATGFCDSGWQFLVPTVKRTTVTITSTDYTAITPGAKVSWSVTCDDVTYSGDAYWTQDVTTNVDDAVRYVYTGAVTGAVTIS